VSLYVARFPPYYTSKDLLALFDKYGCYKATVVTNDKGLSRCFGFADFPSLECAQLARVKVNGQKLAGCRKPLLIELKTEPGSKAAIQRDRARKEYLEKQNRTLLKDLECHQTLAPLRGKDPGILGLAKGKHPLDRQSRSSRKKDSAQRRIFAKMKAKEATMVRAKDPVPARRPTNSETGVQPEQKAADEVKDDKSGQSVLEELEAVKLAMEMANQWQAKQNLQGRSRWKCFVNTPNGQT